MPLTCGVLVEAGVATDGVLGVEGELFDSELLARCEPVAAA
ncbi:MAG TPA: hypothetical protein VHY20_13840 [Pirellulales bacterium]|nr:hypothetical protein [Pirellulales bacterium]